MRSHWPGPTAFLALTLLAVVPTRSDEPAKLREVVSLVRERFYDRATAETWASQTAPAIFQNSTDLDAAIRQSLAALKVSHTAYFTPDDPEYYGLLSIFRRTLKLESAARESIGVDVTPQGFVRVVFAGGPAAKAGILRGDRLLAVNGQPFRPVASFRGRAGQSLTLTYQRTASSAPQTTTVVPRTIEPSDEWLEAQEKGTSIIPVRGKRVAYVPFFACAGSQYLEALQDAIAGPLAEADALVLDFRHGWGGCSPTFVNLFNKAPAVLEQTPRYGKPSAFDSQWRKPLVLLINGGSKSGKEVVAHSVKKHRLGTLVGTHTGGAVLAGQPFLLKDRTLIYLAVTDIRVDGEKLEGRGVPPDVEVPDQLDHAVGADPQKERALEVAARAKR